MWNWLLPSVFSIFPLRRSSPPSSCRVLSAVTSLPVSLRFRTLSVLTASLLYSLLPSVFFLFPLRPSSPPPTPTWHFSSSAAPGNKAVLASPSLSQVVGRVPARNRQEKIERATLVQQFSLLSVIIFDYSKLEMMKL